MARKKIQVDAVVELACECCALWLSNGDDTQCRDYYGHGHPTAEFDGWGVVGVARVETVATVGAWRCDGCGCQMAPGTPAWPVSVFAVVG